MLQDMIYRLPLSGPEEELLALVERYQPDYVIAYVQGDLLSREHEIIRYAQKHHNRWWHDLQARLGSFYHARVWATEFQAYVLSAEKFAPAPILQRLQAVVPPLEEPITTLYIASE
jgi:hypothetical protein